MNDIYQDIYQPNNNDKLSRIGEDAEESEKESVASWLPEARSPSADTELEQEQHNQKRIPEKSHKKRNNMAVRAEINLQPGTPDLSNNRNSASVKYRSSSYQPNNSGRSRGRGKRSRG
eukprot:UN28809